ncbi:MAG: NAD-dependent deacylase [Phycisphaeraceae bacterium]|nr:NAD-dependent deacylase [Phycisphaeraceae bacterium]
MATNVPEIVAIVSFIACVGRIMSGLDLEHLTRQPRPITILTGAGISAESGLATFRGADGLWEGHRVEDVATPEAYARDPRLVHTFYNQRRARLGDPSIQPNAAHRALGELARDWPAPVHLITQNVDNLHERGGSPEVIHMHGELTKVRNDRTGEVFEWTGECWPETPCPRSGAIGVLRPHIVWFGEAIMEHERIAAALADPALFLCIGTAGAVWPAAGFVQEAKARGTLCVEFNLTRTQISVHFDRSITGPASETVPAFIRTLMTHT